MRQVGYARVSTTDQNLDLQQIALRAAGCVRIYTDEGISGANFERPGLAAVLDELRPGDTFVVWRLDRLGRSLVDLIKLISELGERRIEFRSLSEAIDTSSSGGRLLFHLLAAMAEFERSLISERTRAGMAAARARGRQIGRRPALTGEQRREARLALANGSASVETIAEKHGIHPRTLLRVLKVDVAGQEAAR
ncbi:recombinase family protein [Mesorhizobium sp. 1B3]|uniref:recombinase family protein n=1 Tax=Mesorhizobium sp. 1B3 TaxID=3243599 RepID=UPI003D9624E7